MEGIHEAIIPPLQYMAATPGEKVYRAPSLCSVWASSTSSLSSARQAALATIRAEWLRHGGEKCTVVGNYERNQFNEFPPFARDVYKSGRWPDTNNNLLRGCLQKAQCFTERGENSVISTVSLLLFSLCHTPNTAALITTWPWCLVLNSSTFL